MGLLTLYFAGFVVIYRLLDYWRRHQPHGDVPTGLIITMAALWPLMAVAFVWQKGYSFYQKRSKRP